MFERRDEDGWAPDPTSAEAGRADRRLYATAALFGLIIGAILGTIAHPPRPRLLWNASASVPIGLYLIRPARTLSVGDLVAARAPRAAQQLAAQRGYLPEGVPLLKHIAALGGHRVCASATKIIVNGRTVAARAGRDGKGRIMPLWHGCRSLQPYEILLLNRAKDSFDSRYFGPVRRSAVLGKAVLLWAR